MPSHAHSVRRVFCHQGRRCRCGWARQRGCVEFMRETAVATSVRRRCARPRPLPCTPSAPRSAPIPGKRGGKNMAGWRLSVRARQQALGILPPLLVPLPSSACIPARHSTHLRCLGPQLQKRVLMSTPSSCPRAHTGAECDQTAGPRGDRAERRLKRTRLPPTQPHKCSNTSQSEQAIASLDKLCAVGERTVTSINSVERQ